MDRNKLSEIISDVIYKENQNAIDTGYDVLCNATEYLADKIAEAICNCNGIEIVEKIYKIVEQECSGCGKHFHLKYCSDGNYEYIDEVCDCLATFHPVDGEPSFGEWMNHIKE